MEQPRHAGHDDFAHVGGLRLLVGFGEVAVDGVAHLRVHRSAVLLPAAVLDVGLRQRGDRRHPPVARRGRAAVAGLARDAIAAALQRAERLARPRQDLVFHEPHDLGAVALLAAGIDRIVGRVRWRAARSFRGVRRRCRRPRGARAATAVSASPKPREPRVRLPRERGVDALPRRARVAGSPASSSSSAASCGPRRTRRRTSGARRASRGRTTSVDVPRTRSRPRLGAAHVADVVEHELVDAAAATGGRAGSR